MNLGLDASTSCCGYAFSEGNVIVDAGWIDTSKEDTFRAKSAKIINFLNSTGRMGQVECIYLESAVSGFSPGFTSQQTIVLLSRWNAVFEYILQETFGLEKVVLLTSNQARKAVFGACRIKGMKPKEFVRQELAKLFDLTPYIKFNKIGNEDKRNSDTLDAIVLSLHGHFSQKTNSKDKKTGKKVDSTSVKPE
jgi:hypothetical protein